MAVSCKIQLALAPGCRRGFLTEDTLLTTETINSITLTVTYRSSESVVICLVAAFEDDGGGMPELNLTAWNCSIAASRSSES